MFGNPLIGLMGLRDIAGAAQDGGNPMLLELAGFGHIGDRVGRVRTFQMTHEPLGR